MSTQGLETVSLQEVVMEHVRETRSKTELSLLSISFV